MRGVTAIAIVGLSALCAAGLAGAGVGKWGPPHGLYGGRITSLAIDPGKPAILYAATPVAGVFKSTDGARSWRPTGNGLERVGFASTLAVDPHNPGTVYLGGTRVWEGTAGGVFKTTDGGRSWRSTGLGVARAVSVIAIDPHRPDTVYAGTGFYERRAGVLKSTNGGRSWVLMTDDFGSDGFPAQAVRALVVDPHRRATIYAATFPGGVFKSTDGGRTWRAVNAGLEQVKVVETVVVDPVTPDTLYAGAIGFFKGERRGVFKSTDGGASWDRTSVGLRDESAVVLAIDPRNPTTLYADADPGMFKSVDGGASWTAMTRAPQGGASQIVVDPSNPKVVYVGTRWRRNVAHGVFKSIDGGRTWRAASTGLTSMELGGIAIHPRREAVLYVGTNGDGLFTSTDGARSWRALAVGEEWVTTVEISQRSPSTVYVGTWPRGVLKSLDGGRTWRRANGGLADYRDALTRVNDLAIDPRNASIVYAGTPYGLYKTNNGGRRWRETRVLRRVVNDVVIDPRRPQTIYAGTRAAGVLKSVNGGLSWHAATSGLPDARVAVLAIDPHRPSILYAGLAPRSKQRRVSAGVFKSTDAGDSWRAANVGLPNGRKAAVALAIDPRTPSRVYAVVNGRVFRSANGGRTWHPFDDGLRRRDIAYLEISSNGRVLYAGASNGEVFDYRIGARS
jgi:photosystem II stability/assembly factor-like uncharacterized protein